MKSMYLQYDLDFILNMLQFHPGRFQHEGSWLPVGVTPGRPGHFNFHTFSDGWFNHQLVILASKLLTFLHPDSDSPVSRRDNLRMPWHPWVDPI